MLQWQTLMGMFLDSDWMRPLDLVHNQAKGALMWSMYVIYSVKNIVASKKMFFPGFVWSAYQAQSVFQAWLLLNWSTIKN